MFEEAIEMAENVAEFAVGLVGLECAFILAGIGAVVGVILGVGAARKLWSFFS